MKKIYETWLHGKALIGTNPLLSILLALLFMAVVGYNYLPSPWEMYLLLWGTIFFSRGEQERKSRLWAVVGAYLLIGLGLYGWSLFVTLDLVRHSIRMLIALVCFVMVVLFYLPKERDSFQALLAKLRQTTIAGAYFITIGVSMYLVSFLVVHIFNVENWLVSSTFFRVTLGTATVISLVVLFSMDTEQTCEPGPFYRQLFGAILPKISLVVGILAIIYMIQLLSGYRGDISFMVSYYPYLVLFFIIFLLSFYQTEKQKEKTILSVFFAVLIILSSAFIIHRAWTIPAQQQSFLYPIAINGIFLMYVYYLWKHNFVIDVRLAQTLVAMGLVVFLPVGGYFGYQHFVRYEGEKPNLVPVYNWQTIVSKKSEKTSWQSWQEQLVRRQYGGDKNQESVFFQIEESAGVKPISVSSYAHVHGRVRLSDKMLTYEVGTLAVTLTPDRKALEIRKNGVIVETLPLFTAAKMKPSTITTVNDEYAIYVFMYQYHENQDKPYGQVELLLLTKE